MEKPKVNIYFSGCGLLEVGLLRGGVEVQQSFELDEDCCFVARANMDHDIVKSDLTRKLVREEKPCDVRGFTWPCKAYSPIADINGARTGNDLFLHAFRHMAIDPPEVFFAENVPGMKHFPVVMEAMTQLPNYYVTVICPVSSHIWLPQKRDRLIIIGSKKSFNWRPPESRKRLRLSDIVDDDPKITIPKYVYKRLNGTYRDKPIVCDPSRGDLAPTCLAHYSKDLSTRLVVDKRFRRGVRPFTVREYARLQGVPDSFIFPVPDSAAYQMIGNGVSVPVGEWIAREIVRYFKFRGHK